MDEHPFPDLKISSSDFLDEVESRQMCNRCNKSRRYFCYTCFTALPSVADRIPKIKVGVLVHREHHYYCRAHPSNILKRENLIEGWNCLRNAEVSSTVLKREIQIQSNYIIYPGYNHVNYYNIMVMSAFLSCSNVLID